ncbi:MAG: hypothetical protein TYPL_3890 [Candidatus Tyloplasma litorale]|nr:MAG: hypothetical protein TYPL_3890 [Mycoplasmatales bacterium]
MLKKIILLLTIIFIPFIFVFSVLTISETTPENNTFSDASHVSYDNRYTAPTIKNVYIVEDSITDSSAQIYVIYDSSNNNVEGENLILHLAGHDGNLTTSAPVDGITLTLDYGSGVEFYYTISGLEPDTEYTIISAQIGSDVEDVNLSFTTKSLEPEVDETKIESIEMVDELITDSTARIIVKLSSDDFDIDDIAIHLEGHDGGISTTNSVDGIGLNYISTHDSQTIYFDITGLSPETTYTIESAEVDSTSTDFNVSFTTTKEATKVEYIELEDNYTTDSSAKIIVHYSSNDFDEDDLILHLDGYDEGLSTSSKVDGISLKYNSTYVDGIRVSYTIEGLEADTEYTITTAEINDIETDIDLSFTTEILEVESIEIVDGSITDSSVQIKVTVNLDPSLTSSWWFDESDLILYFEGYDEGLSTTNSINDGTITLTHDSTNETEIIYTISGLEPDTEYTIESAEITSTLTEDINLSFTTESSTIVESIEIVDGYPTPNSVKIKVSYSSEYFDPNNLILNVDLVERDLSTSNPVNGITLTYNSTSDDDPTEAYYTIDGLEEDTKYVIISAKINDVETNIDLSFKTRILTVVESIEMAEHYPTDSEANIIVSYSSDDFDEDDLVLHLEGHDGDLTTSNPVDGISLKYNSTYANGIQVSYTILGLEQDTKYTITTAEINDIEINIDLSFTTEISEVESIEIVDGSITDSSVQIKVNVSSTSWWVDESDLILYFEGYDEGLSTTNSINDNSITLAYDSIDGMGVYYTISGLESDTTYTIESAETTSNLTEDINLSFTTESLAIVESIEIVDGYPTPNSVKIKVSYSSEYFDPNNLILNVDLVERDLTTSNPVNGMTLTYNSTSDDDSTEAYYTIEGLEEDTKYVITSAKINDVETNIGLSFKTRILTVVESIEMADDYPTDSEAKIIVSYSSDDFDEDDLVLHLEDYDEGLTTSNPVDGISLEYNSTYINGVQATYTISGLEPDTEYTITTAEMNDVETNIDLSFTTKISVVESIEIVDGSITDSSVQIKVNVSSTSWWVDESDLILHLEGYDEGLSTTNSINDGSINLIYDSTDGMEVYYTISGLEPDTTYIIESAETTSNLTEDINLSFTTESLAIVESIEIDTSFPTPTDSAIKIKVSYSSEYFDPNDLILHLVEHSGDLTTSNPVDGISLIYNSTSTNKTEAYYTIEGLEEDTTYVITSAEINDISTNIGLSFKTEISKVESIEIVDDSITDSSVQIGVTVSSTSWWVNKSDLVIHLAGYDEGLSTTNPIGDISLIYDSVDGMEVYYTISGLEANTKYTIESTETTSNVTDINQSFTTLETPSTVDSIEVIDESITDSSAQIKVTTSTTNFDADELILHLAGHDGDLTTSTPIDGITLTHDSTNETEITYTISGLEPDTEYTITNAEINDDSIDMNVPFTTLETPSTVDSIEVIDNSITDSSAQIKVTTSTTNFDENELILHLAGHDGDLTTSTPIDGITLTHDSTNETEITYTISGLEADTEYIITSAEINDDSIDMNVPFTTLEIPAIVDSIEVIDESITDSSAKIKVITSTTNFDEDNLILHLANHDGDLTTSTSVDGITLTHDSTGETEIIYTISGLEPDTEYTITNAEINDDSIDMNVPFTTLEIPAIVDSIEVIDDSITDFSAQIKVITSTTNFNVDELILHLANHDGDLTTSTPIDGITLTHDSTNETEIYYTISGLESNTEYTITSAKLNDIETEDINLSFTTLISPAEVTTIEVVDNSITDSSAQIKVTTSTTEFDENDLVLHLEGHDGDLTTSNPVDGITLTHDSTNETEIYYTISKLESDTEYTITSAKLNDIETEDINLSFTTLISPAEVTTIEVIDNSITDSSAQIKVTTSTTNFDADELILHLANHDGDLTTSTSIDGITLTHDSTNETEITYTISGLEADTEYIITSAEINDDSIDMNVPFTTLETPAIVDSIEVIDNSITDSSAQIKVTTSTTNFDVDELILHLAGHDGDLTTSTPIDGITLTYDWTNETEIYYTISELESGTEYTITSAKLNDNDGELSTAVSFTTLEIAAIVNSIQVVTDSVTDSSAQIKVTTSTTNFDENDLILHLTGHDGDLTTLTTVDGITLTHDSTNETEIYYTISGLESNTTYIINNAEINDDSIDMDVPFTTLEIPAKLDSIEIVTDSITDSSAQIKVITSTTNFDEDNLILLIEGHINGSLSTTNSIHGAKLTCDSNNGTEIMYTISGLEEESEYTITSAKLNSSEINVDETFWTLNNSLDLIVLIMIIIAIILLILFNWYLFKKLRK